MTDIEINDAWEWVASRTGQELSPLAKKVCHVLSCMGCGGIHNRPVAWDSQDWTRDHCVTVNFRRDLSNWDGAELTALWGWCAALMLRVSVRPSGPQTIKLMFWQRSSRDGGVGERLPFAEQMLVWVGLPHLANELKRASEMEKALQAHHRWHMDGDDSENYAVPDGKGGWIGLNRATQYADSQLYEQTVSALSKGGQ